VFDNFNVQLYIIYVTFYNVCVLNNMISNQKFENLENSMNIETNTATIQFFVIEICIWKIYN